MWQINTHIYKGSIRFDLHDFCSFRIWVVMRTIIIKSNAWNISCCLLMFTFKVDCPWIHSSHSFGKWYVYWSPSLCVSGTASKLCRWAISSIFTDIEVLLGLVSRLLGRCLLFHLMNAFFNATSVAFGNTPNAIGIIFRRRQVSHPWMSEIFISAANWSSPFWAFVIDSWTCVSVSCISSCRSFSFATPQQYFLSWIPPVPM